VPVAVPLQVSPLTSNVPWKSEHWPKVEKLTVPAPVVSSMLIVPVKERPDEESVQPLSVTVCSALLVIAAVVSYMPEKTAVPPPGHVQVVNVVDVHVQLSVMLLIAFIASLA